MFVCLLVFNLKMAKLMSRTHLLMKLIYESEVLWVVLLYHQVPVDKIF